MSNLLLRFLVEEGRFIKHPYNPDGPISFPAFVQGNVLPVRLVGYRRSDGNQSRITPQSLAGTNPELSIGSPGDIPNLGFWFFTFGADTSSAIPIDAEVDEVTIALGLIPSVATVGGIEVVGTPGDFVFTFKRNGVQTLASVTYEGGTLASVNIETINAGDDNSPAQWAVQIYTAAVASCKSWYPDNTTAANVVSDLGNGLWCVALDSRCEGGFFKLALAATASEFISLYASNAEIRNALNAIAGSLGANAQVTEDQTGEGTFLVSGVTALTLDGAALQIPPALLGSLDLTGEGVEELLSGASFQGVELAVTTNSMWTNAIAPVTLRRASNPTVNTSQQIPNPAFGTPTGLVNTLPSVTGHTGGGPTNLDGVYTLHLRVGTVVEITIPGPPDITEKWALAVDENWPTASDPDNGIVAPLDSSTTNRALWLQRQ